MDHSLGDQLFVMLAKYGGEYRVPYIETDAEYKYLSVLLKGRPGTDTWVITDGGSDTYRYSQNRFSMGYDDGETFEDWHADTRRPLAEAFARAEVVAGEMRHERDQRRARMVARHEANRATAHP
jgi:hypothetical protein